MERKTVGAVAAVLLMIPGVIAAQSSAPPPQGVIVRSYNHYGVSAEDLHVARAHAQTILLNAGIKVTWMDCWFRDGAPADASPRCRQALSGTELVLRLQAGNTAAQTKYISMGFSLVNPGEDTAFLSTVFADLVQTVARRAAIDPRRLLGLAIAHEIGHVLLNTNSHATAGLMRAGWSPAELRRNIDSDWCFLESEAGKMRASITMRGSGN